MLKSPALAKTVFEVVSKINEDGVTVVIVEQNIGVLPYADRALIMEKGTLIYTGVGDEIRTPFRETWIGDDIGAMNSPVPRRGTRSTRSGSAGR